MTDIEKKALALVTAYILAAIVTFGRGKRERQAGVIERARAALAAWEGQE